jgi:hypothetical protein
MTEPMEWDYPPTKRHRRPRLERMEPEETTAHLRITVSRHRTGPPAWLNPAILILAPIVLIGMFPMGFVMLAALLGLLDGGWQTAQLVVLAITVLVVAVWRWSHGRPF